MVDGSAGANGRRVAQQASGRAQMFALYSYMVMDGGLDYADACACVSAFFSS
jgi:hypothetical protein